MVAVKSTVYKYALLNDVKWMKTKQSVVYVGSYRENVMRCSSVCLIAMKKLSLGKAYISWYSQVSV